MTQHTDQIPQAIDVLKVVGLLLGGYGAILSTFNFWASHYGKLIVEFQTSKSSLENIGTVRILCVGRPRFVETVSILDSSGKSVLEIDIMETLSRGEARKVYIPEKSVRERGTYTAAVASERKIFRDQFSQSTSITHN